MDLENLNPFISGKRYISIQCNEKLSYKVKCKISNQTNKLPVEYTVQANHYH